MVDVAGGPQLFEVWNALAGAGLSSSRDLAAWAGPDGSGVWDGEVWHGGQTSVAVAISSSAGNPNGFGLYRDLSTGGGKSSLYNALSGDSFLGPVFDAEFLFANAGEVRDVGFWLSSRGDKHTHTFHGNSELDSLSRFGHLTSFHFDAPISVHSDAGDLVLRNAHLLAWEDWTDADYDDLVFVVGEAGAPAPVPEPGTGLLVACGLVLALAWRSRPRGSF